MNIENRAEEQLLGHSVRKSCKDKLNNTAKLSKCSRQIHFDHYEMMDGF